MHIDYIIVGQGIAGTCLSYQLLKKQKKVVVVDNSLAESSSKVAAGICNPITGKRFQKTWRADEIFPYLKNFYAELESLLQCRFFYEMPVHRIFHSIYEQNLLAGRASAEEWKDYLDLQAKDTNLEQLLDQPLGGWETRQSYRIDVALLLEKYRGYLKEKESYLTGKIKYEEIHTDSEGVEWNGFKAKKIIFCEGYGIRNNPFFRWLPFLPAKGEWIKVRIPGIILKKIIFSGIFIVPLSEELFQVGATYEWNDLNYEITQKAKEELTRHLEEIITRPFEVVDQFAGIRPASADRRPYLGLHPGEPSLAVFNGMGTKGISLSPYFSMLFSDFLENASAHQPDQETDISRYYHHIQP